MPDARREEVYTLLDELLERVGDLQAAAFKARNTNSACWLASAEDAIAEFVEEFDNRVDAHEGACWDRAQERALENADNYPADLARQAEEARRLK